jgi:alkaline phosphatase
VTLTTSAGDMVGTFDVIDGKVTIPFTAPTTSGPLTLTLTGVQTGKIVTAKVTVR